MIVQGLVKPAPWAWFSPNVEGRFLNAFPNRVLRRDPLPYRELSRFARMSAGAAPRSRGASGGSSPLLRVLKSPLGIEEKWGPPADMGPVIDGGLLHTVIPPSMHEAAPSARPAPVRFQGRRYAPRPVLDVRVHDARQIMLRSMICSTRSPSMRRFSTSAAATASMLFGHSWFAVCVANSCERAETA